MHRFLETYAYQDWLITKRWELNRTIMAKKTASVVTHLSCHEAQKYLSSPTRGWTLAMAVESLSIRTTRSPEKSPFIFYEYAVGFFFCGYHEADVEHLVHIIVYIDTSLTSITYKNSFYSLLCFWCHSYIFILYIH